jgi:hypothetical protein
LEREQVKQQILYWLSEEQKKQKLDVKIGSNEHYYYFACIVIFESGLGCNVCIEKDIERVNIITNAVLGETDRSSYRLTPDKAKLWVSWKIENLRIGVNVVANPDVENLQNIQLSKVIYFDSWSRDKLMEAVIRITDALEPANFIFGSFSQNVSKRRQ